MAKKLNLFDRFKILCVLVVGLYSCSSYGGEFMGLFSNKLEVVYPASGFEGQLLYKGQPASGAVIERVYDQMEQGEVKEKTVADEQGRFKFLSVALDYKEPWLSPVSYQSHQTITVTYKELEIEIWRGSKSGKGEFSEFSGKPKNFTCELTEQKRSLRVDFGFFGTNCHWDVE